MKNNKVLTIISTFIFLLILQFMFGKICEHSLYWFARKVPDLSNETYLMIHHAFMFVLLFVPTYYLCMAKQVSFGYQKGNPRPFFRILAITVLFGSAVTMIQILNGLREEWSIGRLVFQL